MNNKSYDKIILAGTSINIPKLQTQKILNKNNSQIQMKWNKCQNCGAQEYKKIDYKTYKCSYCGTEYIDHDLHEIEIQQEVYDIQFSDGTNYQIPKRRKIIEVRYELSNNDYY